MFTEISNLLRKGDTFAFTVAREDDTRLRVNLMPKLFTLDGENGADRRALNQPVTIVGTVEELDSPAFIEKLNAFTGAVNATRHTFEEVEQNLKSAAEAKKNAVAAAAKSKSAHSKPAAKKPDETKAEAPAAEPEPTEETESIL